MSKNKRTGINQNIPTYKELIEQGYCPRYYDNEKPELSAAYEELRESNPEGYKKLMDFDYHQGRRDYAYKSNKDVEFPELGGYEDHRPLCEWFDSSEHGQYLLAVANLLADGWSQEEIAEQYGCNQMRISR